MSIFYGLVAQGTTIKAEYKTNSALDDAVVQAILLKIPPTHESSRLTYVYERYLFHYISKDGLIFMCVSNDAFGRRVPFLFLQDIQSKYLSSRNKDDFSTVIKERMAFYSNNDDFKKIQGDMDHVKDVMSHNIERVLERGGRIDVLVNKTDGLSQQAFGFKRKSIVLKRNMWWKNVKMIGLICLVVIIILSVILILIFGLPGKSGEKGG